MLQNPGDPSRQTALKPITYLSLVPRHVTFMVKAAPYTGPPAWPIHRTQELVLKLRFRYGQNILFPSYPHVEGRQQEDADGEGPNQPADNDNGKRPLRVGPNTVRCGGRKQTKSG